MNQGESYLDGDLMTKEFVYRKVYINKVKRSDINQLLKRIKP